ncbi:hypothetical protein KAU93_04775 [Candidatus Bathyarchaeota archaeon]|nr:hypothetical protein [Candidatus Bathyarchaeota archaeon]
MEKTKLINNLLSNQGAAVVQKKPGLGNRPALYGYLPQAVFSAVAEQTDFTNTVDHFEFTEKQAIALVTVTIGTISHSQFGESQIITSKSGFADRGSAMKGAVTDAIEKALALFGIGDLAYLGKLEAVYNKKISYTEPGEDDSDLLKDAKTVTDRAAGVIWWKKNLSAIQQLSQEQRDKIVKILGGK